MNTIINKDSGLVLYCAETFDLKENEVAIDNLPALEYNSEIESLYYNFNTKEFYAK